MKPLKTLQLFFLIFTPIILFSICPAQNGTSSPLRITKQTRPSYTEEARRAGAEGIITLQVEFRADGTIGEVTLYAKHIKSFRENPDPRDYGLADQAIKAAKTTEFTPASVDGKPVTVRKSVEFPFALY